MYTSLKYKFSSRDDKEHSSGLLEGKASSHSPSLISLAELVEN
jgi:hypothetical protein